MNLLSETKTELKRNKKTPTDVRFVTDGKNSCSWDVFKNKAKDKVYNEGFGGSEINSSLKVVGKNWWLERCEYDGSEWWKFKILPPKGLNVGNIELEQEY